MSLRRRAASFLTCACVIGLAMPAGAQTRRALVIGINKYNYTTAITDPWKAALPAEIRGASPSDANRRGNLDNLDAAVSDAEAIAKVLESRFLFDEQNVVLLENEHATRDAILVAIKHLVEASQPGDVVVFFYAGHGSQRYNSLVPSSVSITRMDQTIVPADANIGQYDIRNAELTELFDQLLAKDVLLSLIFDSCNSGGAVRGIATMRARFAAYDLRDARDPLTPESVTRPGRKNPAVFLAAAHEAESAVEDAGTGHGLFTAALLDVLSNPAISVNSSAEQVFQAVEAGMRARNASQTPVLRGTGDNHRRPLFGNMSGPLAGRTTLALQGRAGDTLILSGGAAMGIGIGSELRLVDSASSPVRVRIVAIPNLITSRATVIAGNASRVRAPALFVLDRWVLPAGALLTAWVPPAGTTVEINQLAADLSGLRSSPIVDWVTDPTALPDDGRPLYVVERMPRGWGIRTSVGGWLPLTAPTAAAVQSTLAAEFKRLADSLASEAARLEARHLATPSAPKKPRLFVLLPPLRTLVDSLRLDAATSPIRSVAEPDSAQYVLAGRIGDDNVVSYAWMLPDASRSTANRSPFTPRTNWVSVRAPDSGSDSLFDAGVGLARVNYWLTVRSHDATALPYHLALRRTEPLPAIDKSVGDTTPNLGGEKYVLVLRKDSQAAAAVVPKFVYVFAISSDGKSTLLFGESQNVIPPADANGAQPSAPNEVVLTGGPFPICPAYGVDTFIMVASSTPFPAPQTTFQFGPVQTDKRDVRGNQREVVRDSTADWSIQRLSILSAPPPNTRVSSSVCPGPR
jgi:hypothetical protein